MNRTLNDALSQPTRSFLLFRGKVQHRQFTLCHFHMRGMNGRTTSHHYRPADTKFYSMNEILLPYTFTVPVPNDFFEIFARIHQIIALVLHFSLFSLC